MKKIILIFIWILSKITILIYPHSFAKRTKWIYNKIYTSRISSKFKHFGKLSNLSHPIMLHGTKYISIGENFSLGARSILTAWDKYENDFFSPEIIIGNNVNIGEDSHITAINKIEIGDNVLIGKKVTISDNSHGKNDSLSLITPVKRPLYSKGPVSIGNGVWLGDKVTVLSGVSIGANSIIGANSVVTKNIPENCIAGGIPARIIKILN